MAEVGPKTGVWLYSDDRIFTDRIASVAASLSVPFRRIGDEDLTGLASQRGLLLLDLDMGVAAAKRVIALSRSTCPGNWHVCGYGSHVDSIGLRALRDAGADRVVSRAHLVRNLQQIIQEVVTG